MEYFKTTSFRALPRLLHVEERLQLSLPYQRCVRLVLVMAVVRRHLSCLHKHSQGLLMQCSSGSSHPNTRNLVIFLHGWPDTAGLWSHVIKLLPSEASSAADLTVVAPDLPGFGGTDNLPSYGPNDVLTAVLQFCQLMRERYLSPASMQDR